MELIRDSTFIYRSEDNTPQFAVCCEVQGKVEEAAKNVLIVLKARGVPVAPHARDRIRACADAAQLERWLERAVHIEHIDELFQ